MAWLNAAGILRTGFAALAAATLALSANWPAYRGPDATGVGDGKTLIQWNADPSRGSLRGIRWKTPIPGLSHASPVIWGERIYLATAVSKSGNAPLKIGLYGAGDSAEDAEEQSWVILALDKNSGRPVWQQIAHKGVPKVKRHTKATHANTTLATDGKRLVAFFGSEGLHAYSLDGRPLWKKDFGVLDMAPFNDRSLSWGFASSPALFEDTIVIQADVKKDAFLAALSAEDGRELWRVARGEVSQNSWGTPGIIQTGGRTQVVCNGYPFIVSYDLKTGKELWRLKSEGDIPVPVPFFHDGLIYVANAHGGKSPLYAIRPDASGDISLQEGSRSSSGVVWSQERNGSYLSTPVAYQGMVYATTSNGIFKAYDAKSGEKFYEQRLGDGKTGFTSSPVAANGHIYITSEEGDAYVVKAGRTFEVAATNPFGEIVLSTPAIDNGVLYFHTRGHLVAIGEDDWDKLGQLRSGTELRVFRKGTREPLNAQLGEATEENLVVVVGNGQSAIPRDQIDRIDARPSSARPVTRETKTRDSVDTKGKPERSYSSGVSVGSKPGFETVYRRR